MASLDPRADDSEGSTEALDELTGFEELFHLAPVGLAVLDRELKYTRTNRAYAEIVEECQEELTGRSFEDAIPEELRARALAVTRKVIETGVPLLGMEVERRVPDDPDRERSWLINLYPLKRGGAVTGLIGVLQDVGSIRRAEEAARERLNELESIYRNAPVGLTFTDSELRYLRVNQQIADMNGVTIEEMVGKTYRDFSPETAEVAEPFLRGLVAKGEPTRGLEVRSIPPADPGVEHTYLLNMEPVRNGKGVLVGHVAAVQDVTDWRRTEDTAARRLRELETLYANTPVGLCYLDADLRIVHSNPLFAQLSDRPSDEMVGAHAREILRKDFARQLLPELESVARTGMSSDNVEIRDLRAGSPTREYTWIAHAHAAKAGTGEIIGVITVVQDVTALMDRRREIEAVRDRLAEAQRIASFGSWEWNLLDDEVWWSSELFEIFGENQTFDPSYAAFVDHVHPDDRQKVRRQLDQTLEGDEPYRMTFRIVRRDGSEREVFTAARLERTPTGQPARLVGTCQDVTEFEPLADEAKPGAPVTQSFAKKPASSSSRARASARPSSVRGDRNSPSKSR